jgi:hypothetical protein
MRELSSTNSITQKVRAFTTIAAGQQARRCRS